MSFSNPQQSGGGVSTPVSVANGGTGLSALGSGLQVLRTNSGATAMEWVTLPTIFTPNKAIVVSATGTWTAYSTVAAAITAATANQLVVVNMPICTERLTLKHLVDLLFLGDVSATGAATTPVFTDNGSSVTCKITILGDLQYVGSSVPTNTAGILQVSSTSNIELVVTGKVAVTKAGASIIGGTADSGAVLNLRCRELYGNSGGVTPVQGIDVGAYSAMTLTVDQLVFLDGAFLTDTGTGGCGFVGSFGGDVQINGGPALATTPTSLSYFTLRTPGAITGSTDCITWGGGALLDVTALTMNAMSGAGLAASSTTGPVSLDVHGINGTTYGMDIQAGQIAVTLTRDTRLAGTGTGGVALQLAADTFTCHGNLGLVSEGTATDSVTAAGAQTMKCWGTVVGNKAKNANVTIQVAPAGNQIFSDANVT